jgi:hypothetical protein
MLGPPACLSALVGWTGEYRGVDLGLLAAIVGSVAGVVTVVVAVLAWRRPRTPSGGEKSKKNVVVEVAYAMPLYDTPDGTQEFGEDMVSITARNATDQPVKVNGWGVHLPGNRNMLVRNPTTSWEPRLPHWVKPGDDATWYLPVDQMRAQSASLAFLGVPAFDVDLEFSGGVSEASLFDVVMHVSVDGV